MDGGVRRRRLLLVTTVAALSMACGPGDALTDDSSPVMAPPSVPTASSLQGPTEGAATSTPATEDAEQEWERQRLDGAPGPDQPMLFETSGDQTIVIVAAEDGRITPWRSLAGGPFEQGDRIDTGVDYVFPSTAVRTGEGWLALIYDGLTNKVGTLRSTDGLRWSLGAPTGFGSAEPRRLVATDDGFVAIGTIRMAEDPSRGGFRPMAWRSVDGDSWTATALPLPTASVTDATAADALAVDGELLAVGRSDDRGIMWSSVDGGSSWEITQRDGFAATYEIGELVATDGVVLASATVPASDETSWSESSSVLVRSTNAGRTWSIAAQPPPPSDEGFPLPVTAGAGQFLALNSFFPDIWQSPELCYADLERCQADTSTTLYVSTDSDRWQRVDASGIVLGQYSDIDTMVIDDDGRIVVLVVAEGGVDVWTWGSADSLPTSPEPDVPMSDVRILGENETLPPDRRYGYPLYIHCGMDWLYRINGTTWKRSDRGPDVETGAGDGPPSHWPVAQQTIFGFATLVEDDVIEYSIGDGEVIATYAPSRTDPPGCA